MNIGRQDVDGNDIAGDDGQLLMAYADGQLSPEAAAAVEARLAADAGAARTVAAHRALRARVDGAYAGVLEEPVAPRLRAVLRSTVGPFRSSRPRWSGREWLAMAASVLVGLAVGALLLSPREPGGDMLVDARLTARDALSRALDRQSSGPAAGIVQVVLSLRAADGRYCRAFTVRGARPLGGLACRSGNAWQVTTLAAGDAVHADQMRQAGSALPAAVLADIDARIQGESLDAKAERVALARGWR